MALNIESRIKFSQVNLHKAIAATATHDVFLSQDFSKNSKDISFKYDGYISLIQEPHFNHKTFKVSGFSRDHRLYLGRPNSKNRAGILTHKNAKTWQIHQYCNEDVCTVGMHLQDGNILIISSVYMEYTQAISGQPPPKPPPPQILKDLADFCQVKGWMLLIGSDSNCHSTSFGSSNDNQRGHELLEWLATTNLHVLNVGNAYTFSDVRRQEVIDITMGDTRVSEKVLNWHVSNSETMSDHRRIEFDLVVSKNRTPPKKDTYRNIKKTDWVLFNQILTKEISEIDTCTDNIDTLANKLEISIVKAYNSSCKERPIRGKRRPPWWNKSLTIGQRELHRAFVKKHRYDNVEFKEEYDRIKSEYRSNLVKAKNEGWKKFCDELSDLNTATKIKKVISSGNQIHLGSVKDHNGEYTSSPEETLRVLLDTHFPNLPETEQYVKQDYGVSNIDVDEIFNRQSVRASFRSFSPYKSPGPDGIYPAMLQHGSDAILDLVVRIFQISMQQGKIPKSWLRTRVVFIPKVGKVDYSDPKSLRPISLTSFLLKGMERCVFWHLNKTTFRHNKLHKNLFSYKESISTEDALHKLVHRIEKSLEKGEISVALFLDIDAAFSKASITSILNNMVRKNIDPAIIKWSEYLLCNRLVEASLNGECVVKIPNRGTPQGGVMSIIFWNLEPDDLLDRFPRVHPSMINAFADDIVDLVSGIDISTIEDRLQQDARVMERWAASCGLGFSASKTKLMVFTRKKYVRDPKVTINNVQVEVVSTFKYLGVTFDSKLTWSNHIQNICRKANLVMMQARKVMGRNWGLKPKYARWMYISLVRPILTYGCLVWLNCAYKPTHIKRLEKVQRRGCLASLNAMRTTATQALEVILNIRPIDIHIKEISLKSYLRLHRNGNWAFNQGETHRPENHTTRIMKLASRLPEILLPTDKLINKSRGECEFISIIKHKDELKNVQFKLMPAHSSIINIYTDGSKTDSGCGYGYTTKSHGIKQQSYANLGSIATVFQAEVSAIEAAATHLSVLNPSGKIIKVFVDSQAAIKAVSSYTVDSLCVERAKNALNILGKNNHLEVIWVPAHIGHRGNEVADRLAKLGASLNDKRVIYPEPYLPVPLSYINRIISDWSLKEHQKKWMNPKDARFCRQTRMFVQCTNNKVWKHIQNRDRRYVMYTCQILTGHAGTNKHLFRMKLSEHPSCDNCGFHEETVEHLIGYCPRYNSLRLQLFGNNTIRHTDFHKLSLKKIFTFMVRSKRFC